MSLVNVAESGGTLTKVGGCSGCPDAAAISNQQISGTGTLQFSTDDRASLRFVGLAPGGVGTTPADIAFGIRLQSGVAEVRESGSYKTETTFASGDSFTVAVNGGSVTYARNGTVFYTSSVPATTALRGHAVFFDANGTIRSVLFGGGGAAPTGDVPEEATPTVSANPSSSTQYAVPRPSDSTPKRGKPRY
jgi:hypothetical protein